MADAIENPILNGPYEPPTQHFENAESGPTGVVLDGRRPSESYIPVPPPWRKGSGKGQGVLDLAAGERREPTP